MKLHVFLIWIFLLSSCNQKVPADTETTLSEPLTVGISSLVDSTRVIFDEPGLYMQVKKTGVARLQVHWGASSSGQKNDTLHISTRRSIQFFAFPQKGFLLQQGCGTACSIVYALPLFPNAPARPYFHPLAVDGESARIAYTRSDTLSFIQVEKIFSGETYSIRDDFLPDSFLHQSIRRIDFEGENLKMEWTDKAGRLRKQAFKLPF